MIGTIRLGVGIMNVCSKSVVWGHGVKSPGLIYIIATNSLIANPKTGRCKKIDFYSIQEDGVV